MGYSKADVQMHRDGFGPFHPAVNVKVRDFGGELSAEDFEADSESFDKAMRFAFESAQQRFWRYASEAATEIFGSEVEVYSEGRSAGWVVVSGLPPIEDWDAIALGAWGRFEAQIGRDVKDLSSRDEVEDAIRANRWAEKGAELYNFIDGSEGKSQCLSELKAEAAAAGFGPIIRE